MRVPSFEALRKQTVEVGIGQNFDVHMHQNPKLYKYIWRVFWRSSVCDRRQFLSDTHALRTAGAMSLIDKLSVKNERHWIYNRRLPRHEVGVTPFDRDAAKWRHHPFAPAFDDDPDLE